MTAPLEIRGKPRPVRRFNKTVLISLIGTTGVILLGASAWALRSPDRNDANESRELYNTVTKAIPDGLNALPVSYYDVKPDIPKLGPPLPGDLGAGMIGREREPIPQDNPFRYEPAQRTYAAPNRPSHAKPAPQQTLRDEARASDLFFISKPSNEAQPAQNSSLEDLSGLFARLSPQPSRSAEVQPAMFGEPFDPDPNRQDRKEAFLGDEIDADIYNPHSLQTPISPYQVMAGTVIPASLITGLNSDLPGQIIAQVTEQVYDTPTGQHLLIPQGSRLIGRYDSVVAFGQSRALVVWSRLIMPDGTSIQIDNLPGVDAAGFAGIEDEVDNHGWRLFKAAILSSVLSVSSEIGRDDDNDILNALRDGGQRTINQAGQQVVTRQLQVQPTLTVRPGWRLKVIVNKDLILQPYGASP